jgi:hypothetical protein
MNGEAAGMVPKAIADGQPLKQFGFKKQGPKQNFWTLLISISPHCEPQTA